MLQQESLVAGWGGISVFLKNDVSPGVNSSIFLVSDTSLHASWVVLA